MGSTFINPTRVSNKIKNGKNENSISKANCEANEDI